MLVEKFWISLCAEPEDKDGRQDKMNGDKLAGDNVCSGSHDQEDVDDGYSSCSRKQLINQIKTLKTELVQQQQHKLNGNEDKNKNSEDETTKKKKKKIKARHTQD
ncbi:hypothetical protein PSHT_14617 [Puccinia striiformis]|uniref:Uncharacterized protein n=2 Tax=Puccinia striiformis TaxID=27350 RepID=A0A2S4UJS1_9BASI|nr:hypothetical protein PSHT_14617 [Puccinia striiformis]